MAEADPQIASPPSDETADHEAVLESADTSRSEVPHGQTDAVELGAISTSDGFPGGEIGPNTVEGQPLEVAPISVKLNTLVNAKGRTHVTKQVTTASKPSMPVKPIPSKSNGSPPTPLVKKIIDSGTFGAGSVRTASSKLAVTTKPSVTSALKRTPNSPLTASKPPMTSSHPPAAPPNRRLSAAPAKATAPPVSKSTLSASVSAKPASSTRQSVVSPAGSATSSAPRPRASISEGLKRAPLSSKLSASAAPKPAAKPPPARPSNTAMTQPGRTNSSISSIREVKEDEKALEHLQSQLKEATESLAMKAESITRLESQFTELSTALEAGLIDVASKATLVEQLELEKSSLENKLGETKRGLVDLELKQRDSDSALASMQKELEAATAQTELAESLRAQIRVMEEQVSSSKERLEAFEASTSSDAIVASAEREVLLKAREDLKAETEALKLAHVKALQEAQTALGGLEAKAALINDLNAQVASLKTEKEESAGKLSELEVEILELKETLETVGDQRERLSASVKTLEGDLLKATTATQQAMEEAKAMNADFTIQVEHTQNLHKGELKAASEEYTKVVKALESFKSELAVALAANEALKADALAAEKEHTHKLQEAEETHTGKQNGLLEEIKKLTAELKGQEALYNAKVDSVKEEHSRLLQEAFEQAKNEAGAIHKQELQALRESSSATAEQIQAANYSALEDLKVEHATLLESEVGRLEKTINTQRLELKATQDDLTKAKTALESSHAEVERLINERDEARNSAVSTADISTARDEAVRLAQELANTKDDLAAVTEMLNLTKVSLTELTHNQSRELEEAAMARAEEVTRLRSSHNDEIKALATERSGLLTKLSDVEGELSTLKATVAVGITSAKSTGNGAATPSSPGVTKEELQRLHEAHNLKIYDLEAEHQKSVRVLRDELEASEKRLKELQQDLARKAMEIQYLEQEQEENQEQITRLKEDVNASIERQDKDLPTA